MSSASKPSILSRLAGVLLVGLVVSASPALRAEPTRLSLLVGTASELTNSDTSLWNRLELEQSLGQERFFVALDLQALSLLSPRREWGLGVGGGMNLSLGSSFEWAPSLRFERDAAANNPELVVQSSVRFQLWSILFDTQLAFAPIAQNDEQMFRFRQSIGMSLGAARLREDFVALDLEFQDRIATLQGPAVRMQLRRIGVAFSSKVEF